MLQGVNITNYFKFLVLFLLILYKLLVYCWYGQDVINHVRTNNYTLQTVPQAVPQLQNKAVPSVPSVETSSATHRNVQHHILNCDTLHCVLCYIHCALHCAFHSVLHNAFHCVLYCALYYFHIVLHCILRYALHCSLHCVLHCVLYCGLYRVHIVLHCILHCTLHNALHCAPYCVHIVLHCILRYTLHCVLHRVHSFSCATSRKVAGSIPDGVSGIFH